VAGSSGTVGTKSLPNDLVEAARIAAMARTPDYTMPASYPTTPVGLPRSIDVTMRD
jgi:hypothetical protein